MPSEYDPIALREMFGPGFLDWVTTIDREVDFGVSEGQLYFHWRLRERTREEYEAALDSGAGLFTRVCREVEEHGVHTYQPGPWHAGPRTASRTLKEPSRVVRVAGQHDAPVLAGADHLREDRLAAALARPRPAPPPSSRTAAGSRAS